MIYTFVAFFHHTSGGKWWRQGTGADFRTENHEHNENNTTKSDDIRLVEFDKTLDENVENITIPNFKKLKFDELKTLVSTKGLANEIQKLRKAELVSLLEEDFKMQKKSTTNEMELV